MARAVAHMNVYREEVIREELAKDEEGEKALAMFDLWHELCAEKLEVDIEVCLARRREKPELRDFKGELNTAYPEVLGGRATMVVYVEDTSSVEEIIISHELGHWVLKLQGYPAVLMRDRRNSNCEILLNSLGQHRALYRLQRSQGMEPQAEIDKRAEHDLALCLKNAETGGHALITDNALLFADDRLSCSTDLDRRFAEILEGRYPRTSRIVQTILDTASHYDLADKEGCKRFVGMLIKKLRLSKKWEYSNEVDAVRTLALRRNQ